MGKRCGRCGAVEDGSEFKWQRTRHRRDNLCEPCRKACQHEHYVKHRSRYMARSKERTQRQVERRTRWILSYLSDHPFFDCGESDPIVLEFDHLRDKRFLVSYGIRNMSWALVLAEIGRCEVVCVNCHRR